MCYPGGHRLAFGKIHGIVSETTMLASRIGCALATVLAAAISAGTPGVANAQNLYTWDATGGGGWFDSSNWGPINESSPQNPGDVANFYLGTGLQTVTLADNISLAELRFDGSPGAYHVTGGGSITFDSTGVTIASTVSSNQSVDVALFGTGSVSKAGSGAVTFSQEVNLISGLGTTIVGGSVVVNGTFSSGGITVGGNAPNTGTLSGTGTIADAVTVISGGTVATGDWSSNDLGKLAVTSDVAFSSSSSLAIRLGSGNETALKSDKLDLSGGSGTLSFEAGSTLKLYANGFTGVSAQSYTIAELSPGGVTVAGIPSTDGVIQTFTYDGVSGTNAFTNTINIDADSLIAVNGLLHPGDTFELSRSGANINLHFTPAPVPEPATLLAIAAAGLGGIELVRRRRVAAASPR